VAQPLSPQPCQGLRPCRDKADEVGCEDLDLAETPLADPGESTGSVIGHTSTTRVHCVNFDAPSITRSKYPTGWQGDRRDRAAAPGCDESGDALRSARALRATRYHCTDRGCAGGVF
jgi:hypothetical protein